MQRQLVFKSRIVSQKVKCSNFGAFFARADAKIQFYWDK
ncbi:Hypothetical protein BN2458_PEG0126 [Helicobacter typhlonius]|uniref:Uncharacterized protein n=1 Tax=Helicobacter typhlonius TaxID=76936 RepID=A0A0S4PS16_9HELI|nr:Hypothetical protein BN2458_PEG0126 [Helicobacter typhlonius]